MKIPQNKKQIEQLLSIIKYLAKFVPRLSDLTKEFRALLNKSNETENHTKAFTNIKNITIILTCIAIL